MNRPHIIAASPSGATSQPHDDDRSGSSRDGTNSAGRPEAGKPTTLFNEPVTVERLRHLFKYDPDTGLFVWHHLTNPHQAFLGGRPAFVQKNDGGYFYAKVDDRHVIAHRAAWAIHYGYWPRQTIDHINRVRSDNRIDNLRDVSFVEQNRNHPRFEGPRGPDMIGVYWRPTRGKWQVNFSVRSDGRRTNRSFGEFTNLDEAKAAALQARRELGRIVA